MVAGILVLAIVLLLLKDCSQQPPQVDAGPDAGDAGADAGLDAGTDAGLDAGPNAGHDAGVDAGPDAGAAETLLFDDEDEKAVDVAGGGGGGKIVVIGGGGKGGSGGKEKVYLAPGTKGPGTDGNHRLHAKPGAVAWRVSEGADRVARAERKGSNFDVWLRPGQTFEGVVVEWKDKNGNWNVH